MFRTITQLDDEWNLPRTLWSRPLAHFAFRVSHQSWPCAAAESPANQNRWHQRFCIFLKTSVNAQIEIGKSGAPNVCVIKIPGLLWPQKFGYSDKKCDLLLVTRNQKFFNCRIFFPTAHQILLRFANKIFLLHEKRERENIQINFNSDDVKPHVRACNQTAPLLTRECNFK